MTTKSKPTAGPCIVEKALKPIHPVDGYILKGGPTQFPICLVAKTLGGKNPPTEANVELIQEVFNVYHETGLTPRELKEQRGALLKTGKILEDEMSQVQFQVPESITKAITRFRAAIAGAEGWKV